MNANTIRNLSELYRNLRPTMSKRTCRRVLQVSALAIAIAAAGAPFVWLAAASAQTQATALEKSSGAALKHASVQGGTLTPSGADKQAALRAAELTLAKQTEELLGQLQALGAKMKETASLDLQAARSHVSTINAKLGELRRELDDSGNLMSLARQTTIWAKENLERIATDKSLPEAVRNSLAERWRALQVRYTSTIADYKASAEDLDVALQQVGVHSSLIAEHFLIDTGEQLALSMEDFAKAILQHVASVRDRIGNPTGA